MSVSPDQPVSIAVPNSELYELYRVLDVRRKLDTGQAYTEVRRTMAGPLRGSFPPGTRSRMVRIRLRVNDWFLCYAHQYVNADGSDHTGPDPKWIRVDDVIFKQGNSVVGTLL